MSLDEKIRLRGALREALKVEADKAISKEPVTKSRFLTVASGVLLVFSATLAVGPQYGPSRQLAILGFILSWTLMALALFYILGRRKERQRNRDAINRR